MNIKEFIKFCFLIFVIVFLCIMKFIYNVSFTSLYIYIFWILITILSISLCGYQKDNKVYKKDATQIIIIYVISYLIFTYILGIFLGFIKMPFSYQIIRIIENTMPVIILIFLQELYRYTMINHSSNKKITFMLILSIVLFEIFQNILSYSFSDPLDVFEFICVLTIPALIDGCLLTYMSKNFGFLPCFLYRILLGIYFYIIPIIPDTGVYLNSLFGMFLPALIFLRLNVYNKKKKLAVGKAENFKKFIVTIPLIFFLFLFVGLTSGLFKHYLMAIGSNSMYKEIKKGDAVIVEKLSDEEIEDIELGDILVYKKDVKVVVHRVIKKTYTNGKYVFRTKGDNNETEDGINIYPRDIIGITEYTVPYIGYPSVWLSEAIK